MSNQSIYLKKFLRLLNRVLKFFTGETYWKERIIAAFAIATYVSGNIVEYYFSNVTEHDPPAIWLSVIVLSAFVIGVSHSNYKQYTSVLFKAMIVIINAHVIYVYGTKTSASVEEESFYLLLGYSVFIVTSQMADSRNQLVAYSLLEMTFFSIIVFLFKQNGPMILQPLHLLMFFFVLFGNFLVGVQRLRLTQITGGSSVQFKMLSENARDIQSIISKQFNFLYVNPSVKELSGFTLSDLNGKNFMTLVADSDKEEVEQSLLQLAQNIERKQSVEYRITDKKGKTIWVESIFSLFKPDPNQADELIFAETRDIEARKKLEQEIQQQLVVEEMLIRHSNQFINVDRSEIQVGIDIALSEFGKLLNADGVLVYRMHGKLHDEFRSNNQWFSESNKKMASNFNLVVKINQQLLIFLRAIRGDKSSRGNFILPEQLHEIQVISVKDILHKLFYLIPLQSGNVVNGFVVFVFDESVQHVQSNFFGLIGNMIANAFTRLRAEMRLHEEQLTNEFILRALPDWLYIINKAGEFTGGNEYTTLPPFLPNFDLMGKTFSEVMSLDTAEFFTNTLNDVIESDQSHSFEYQDNMHYKGHFFKVIIAPFKANEYLLIIRDVTELKQAQSDLEKKAKNLAQSNKELEEFAYIVSHDMKQPIRTIISYLSLLKRKHLDNLPVEAQEFINYSIEGANKMSELIRDILQYSKLEQQVILENDIALNEIVNKALLALKSELQKNNAEVACDKLPIITCNQTMMTELFQNLIENGIKYNTNEKKIVTINVKEEDGQWLFSVTDNGIGFEQQYAEQIFKIFKRLHTDQEFQGTGIGLSICAKVIEKHGGKIWAVSEKGKGSTFYFTLPK